MDNETLEDLRKAKKHNISQINLTLFFYKKIQIARATVEKFISKSFERLAEKGVNRGFITHDELQKSLGKRNSNIESLSLIHI